nr:class I SAM-dependent methyltransferase [uncultured Methanobacterium sp.]
MLKDSQSIDSLLMDGAHASTYPLIANQIIGKFKIKKGVGIDVGAGPASLSIALAKITELDIYSMDISSKMLEIAQESFEKEGLEKRIKTVLGDVHQMPFPDEFADLVFSRGSMFFWKDLTTAFREIYRVLKPGGAGYVGGGFGSATVRKKVKNQFKGKGSEYYKSPPKIHLDSLEIAVFEAGITNYILINDDSGLWVLFKKKLDKCNNTK